MGLSSRLNLGWRICFYLITFFSTNLKFIFISYRITNYLVTEEKPSKKLLDLIQLSILAMMDYAMLALFFILNPYSLTFK